MTFSGSDAGLGDPDFLFFRVRRRLRHRFVEDADSDESELQTLSSED